LIQKNRPKKLATHYQLLVNNMNTEIEAKFTNIDKDKIRKKLKDIGAILVHKERLMRRYNMDFQDFRLKANKSWLRIRDEGDKTTLTLKQKLSHDLHGMKELEVNVDDFNKTRDLLFAIGLVPKNYQETFRESWTHGNTHIDIDTWPWIPHLIEIEGEDEESVKEVATKLGFDWSEAKFGSALTAYQEVFDITGDDLHHLPIINFESQPPKEWKRK
jgi:adenylate cyclase class 2